MLQEWKTNHMCVYEGSYAYAYVHIYKTLNKHIILPER